ncbi:mitochondrial protein Pet127-domain-containing protein [Mucor mucedo]|uniref:mitochondrial protein Pet127-domain-containing protein n=1 Tax=Mucor mucedo TaxID=29922 RepID=UPI00221E6D9C|nr:mitochondrial protein Pet127-domain-containing protein [Mucor mucedo]KAI7877079.1 mitochondrial protein Pet127-domain-containing protein [Mucor mucedo]
MSTNGVTEVYIVRRSKDGKRKDPLSKRLHDLTKANQTETTEAQNVNVPITPTNQGDQKWTSIPTQAQYERVKPPQNVPVATLAHGLQKVLFNPGVHYLKDPRTKEFNFTPYLENITQPVDFDYEALTPYITSSRDNSLIDLAKDMNQRYIGSTSSVSAVLSHFYFVMSNFKEVNTSCLSRAFDKESTKFTRGSRTAASIYLRWKDGVYAVDVDKSHDVDETVLSIMGKSLEKVLTLEPNDFERFLKENSSEITEQEKNQPESYAYGKLGKFLLRSQLDCYDSRLPRGTFDLKTRAATPVRLDIQNYSDYLGYSLKRAHGLYESFEREYYDMIRSAFLKYSFQVRIGHMDGIMVAYHNTRKIFGFQYISREEMDSRLFGSTKVGDSVFRNALVMFESILDKATEKYPQQTLRISFDTHADKNSGNATTNVFVEAVPTDAATTDNNNMDEFFQTEAEDSVLDPFDQISLYQLNTQSLVNGVLVEGPLKMDKPSKDHWQVRYKIKESELDNVQIKTKFTAMRKRQADVYTPSAKKNPMLEKFKSMSEEVLKREKFGKYNNHHGKSNL